MTTTLQPNPSALAPRELQVVEALARGLSGKEIGLELGISFKTVSSYVASARGKHGARNSEQLIAILIENGTIQPLRNIPRCD